jgi:hypothetical protein
MIDLNSASELVEFDAIQNEFNDTAKQSKINSRQSTIRNI